MPAEPAASAGRARLAARVFVPLLLLLLVLLEVRGGPALLPRWMASIGAGRGISDESMLRLLMGGQLALAAIALLVPRWARAASTVALLGLIFAAVAEASALVGAGRDAVEFAAPAIVLLAAASLLPITLRAKPRTASRGSTAWRLLVSGGAVVVAIALAARIPLGATPAGAVPDAGSPEIVELAVEDWTGRPIAETGLPRRLPELAALTVEGRAVLVLHDPRCGECHELFATHFATPIEARVVAIRVPPAPGAMLVESDQPSEVVCADCTRLALPEGPTWLVQTPVVVIVEDGVVRCVARGLAQASSCLDLPRAASGS